jgi:hypothetical protein
MHESARLFCFYTLYLFGEVVGQCMCTDLFAFFFFFFSKLFFIRESVRLYFVFIHFTCLGK